MASESIPLRLALGGAVAFDETAESRPTLRRHQSAKARRRIAMFPILFFQAYLTISIFVFAFGPWPWPVSNPWELYGFLILAQGGLFAGYRSAIRGQPRYAATHWSAQAIVIVSLACNFLWIAQTYKIRTAQPTFGVDEALTAVDSGLKDPGQLYDTKQRNAQDHTDASILDYANLLLSPVLFIAFPLGIFSWHRLQIWARVALSAWIFMDLAMWVATGTNKGLADYALLLPCMMVARNPIILANIRPRKLATIVLIAILGAAGLFAFFSLGLVGRSNGTVAPMYDSSAGVSADPTNVTLRFVPPSLQAPLASFASYFVQGYYGLSLSLEQPFVFCYGVGNSFFLEGLSRHFVSTPILDDTYPARIEGGGWDKYGKWHSIYPWIASDLSFPGTLLFMFVLGRLFALVWLDVAFCRNLWAVCLFPLLLIMLFYIPANNQVLGYSEGAIPFWALLGVWLYTRRTTRRL